MRMTRNWFFVVLILLIGACYTSRPANVRANITVVYKDLGITQKGPYVNGERHGKWTTISHSDGKEYHTWYSRGEEVTENFFKNLK